MDESQRIGIKFASRHSYFVPFAFNCLTASKYSKTRFDDIICSTLDRTFLNPNHESYISRLIINIPPRHGKTLRAVQSYVARGFAINPRSNFIHTSYSDKLVHDNSVAIRDIINSEQYQMLYPHVKFKSDTNTKGLWRTSEGGSFLASPAGGSITGFGAGIVNYDGFGGAFIIDDPVKPDDASSDAILDSINSRWEGTFRSRLAGSHVPVIVIMQRISDNDFTEELLNRGGSDEGWHHLVLPVYIDEKFEYKETGQYIEHNLSPGALWDVQFSDSAAKSKMKNIQYSQESIPSKGEVYEREFFKRYTELPTHIKSWSIFCDTASKTSKYNDFTVFQLWAKTVNNHGYLVKQLRKKMLVPHLVDAFAEFLSESKEMAGKLGVEIYIEDKDSGVGLIQALQQRGLHIHRITRREGKYSRAIKATPAIMDGKIFLPVGSIGDSVINEAVKFKANDTHAHDDQIDPMNDFINYQLPDTNLVYNI